MGTGTWGYAYNGIGNRLTSTAGTLSTTYTYFPGTHRLQSLGGANSRAYVFDAAGNMTSDGTSTRTYGGNNRPTQAQAGAITTTFDINALGQRVRKAAGAAVTRFVHDEAGRLIGEYAGDGTLRAEYIWLDELPVAVISAQTRQAGVNDDLDGDAVPDLVFRHAQSGETYAWLLRRDHSVAGAPYLGQVDPVWDLVGTADFNADGNLDLVWRHSVNGAAYVWFYAGTQYIGNSYLFTTDPAWKVASIADFNGDGKPDVILRDRASGTAWAHYFDGTQYLGGEYVFTLDPAWRLAGTADIDRDGKRDFVWAHATTGDAVAWYMNGIQYLAYEYMATVPAGWSVVRVADFDGDFYADLVIRDAVVGAASMESFRGASWVSSTGLYNVDPAWQQAPAGEAAQKAAVERAAPPVNRPLPPGFVKPPMARRAGARVPEFARVPHPAFPGLRTSRDGPPPAGPKPPDGKMAAKSAGTPFAIYHVIADHLGTPRAITRPVDNTIVWRWDNTEPFGHSQPNANPSGLGAFAFNLRFPGQYFDAETGTMYNMARDYDPAIGRYIQSDPIGLKGGINTYAYVDGDPLAGFDPDGLANSGAGRKPGKDYWWRPCNKTQESECKASCEAQGKEFESCAVRWGMSAGLSDGKPIDRARQTSARVSCSCKDPTPTPSGEPMCGKNCQQVMVFLGTAFIVWRTVCGGPY